MREKKILIVEDGREVSDSIKRGLAEKNFHVAVARDVNMGLRLFARQAFDLVLLDINSQGLGVYELCRLIRRQSARIPIIILAVTGRLTNRLDGYNAGADDYMVKPVESGELSLKVKALLRLTGSEDLPPGNILLAADLEMNLDTKEVWRASKPIHLTDREFRLLVYLLHNKNKILSRADIAVNVWNEAHTDTNLVDVYVSFIRNKIDKRYTHKLIRTHRGMGYSFKESRG